MAESERLAIKREANRRFLIQDGVKFVPELYPSLYNESVLTLSAFDNNLKKNLYGNRKNHKLGSKERRL